MTRDNDTISDAAVAVDRRLGYPSRHDWNYLPLPDSHWDWLDAAYEVINQLAAQVEANRVRYTDARRERDEYREQAHAGADVGRRALEARDEARAEVARLRAIRHDAADAAGLRRLCEERGPESIIVCPIGAVRELIADAEALLSLAWDKIPCGYTVLRGQIMTAIGRQGCTQCGYPCGEEGEGPPCVPYP